MLFVHGGSVGENADGLNAAAKRVMMDAIHYTDLQGQSGTVNPGVEDAIALALEVHRGPLPDGWMEIPGAFGCTAQSCAYRDLVAEFEELDAAVRGVSTQASEEQAEFAQREHIPYPLLSDARLTLTTAMRLPTFVAGGKPRIKRASLVIDDDRSVRRVLYPVRDPSGNASATLRALQELIGKDK